MLKYYMSFMLCSMILSNIAGTITDIPPKWQYQAAVNSTTAPDPGKWRTSRNDAFKDSGMKTTEVHNLWLRQEFALPETLKSGQYLLDFELINGNTIVFINGQKAGERPGPFGSIEITGQVRGGTNELLIFLTRNYTDTQLRPENDYLCDYSRGPRSQSPLPYSQWQLNIPKKAGLIFLPSPAAIADAWAETSWRRKEITMHLELTGSGETAVSCKILDAGGQTALEFSRKLTLKKDSQAVDLVQQWENPIPWELEAGYLYTAQIELKDAQEKLLDNLEFPFGFREIWTEGRDLILNGHPCRWRTDWNYFGINEASVSFLKLYGRNMIYYQNNPTTWWRNWPDEIFHVDQAELDILDRAGIAVLLPTLPGFRLGDDLMSDTPALREFRQLSGEHIRRYRRHPSVIGWCVSMNAFNPRDSIHQNTMGQHSNYHQSRAKQIEKSIEITRELDPTRLAYGHADGNNGDIASGNVYPNFSPLQEVADWPELWAKNGNMPWWAAEYAAVYNGSYFKGAQFMMTEYGAIFFGDKIYEMESPEQLASIIEISKSQKNHHGYVNAFPQVYPMKYAIEELYVKATDRAWRTWGITGWHYFNFSDGYGNPPEAGDRKLPWQYRYRVMRHPVTSRPEWANRQFDIYSRYMQPLLAYVAGAPVHTDQTHSYYAGEKIEKNIAVVWDGPGGKQFKARWQLVMPDGNTAASGEIIRDLNVGDIALIPVSFAAPQVAEKTNAVIKLSGADIPDDEFKIQIFPQAEKIKLQRRLKVFDPARKSLAWIKEIYPAAVEFKTGDALTPDDTLIIGREALKAGTELPVKADELAAGTRVLILEQTPDVWTKMGFNTMDLVSRQVFPGTNTGRLLDGLSVDDLANWRGTPDLLPEYRRAYSTEVPMAPKGSNRNGVASTVLEIPVAIGFKPLIQAEFDLAYSPLLQMNYGKGCMIFSTLDFTGRVCSDPAATLLAANLLKTLDSALPVQAQSKKLYIGLTADELKKHGIESRPMTTQRIMRPQNGFASLIPQNLLRWRDKVTFDAITGDSQGGEISGDGLFLQRDTELFLQVAPPMLENRYPNDKLKQDIVNLSVLRLKQLVARVETELGKTADAGQVESILRASNSTTFKNINSWFVFGPFKTAPKAPVDKRLEAAYPGEKQALSGDMNPNFTYQTPDGRTLDFRTTLTMDAGGYVDLGGVGKDPDSLVYAISHINSDTRHKAVFRFGFDYYGMVYLNGKPILQVAEGHSAPMENQFTARATLNKGENTLVIKALPGSKGFGFWANMSDGEQPAVEVKAVPLYDEKIKIRNPYEYIYW